MYFLPFALILLCLDLQNAPEPLAVAETLAEVPEHVLRGLPEEVRLFPSAVDKTRIGKYRIQRDGQQSRQSPVGASEVAGSTPEGSGFALT